MSVNAQGTFTGVGQPSQTMMPNDGPFKLSTGGVDASNTVKTTKSLDGGLTWSDVTTYNVEQTGTVITPAPQEQFALQAVAIQFGHDIKWKMSRES